MIMCSDITHFLTRTIITNVARILNKLSKYLGYFVPSRIIYILHRFVLTINTTAYGSSRDSGG